jgi:hypothetical protein
MEGRVFVRESAFKKHIKKVHAKGLMFAKFEVTDNGTTEVMVGVPYNEPLKTEKDEVAHEAKSCDDCMANGSAARLPIHPSCACAPAVGWENYIENLEQPEDVAEDLWTDFLKYLGQAKAGKI